VRKTTGKATRVGAGMGIDVAIGVGVVPGLVSHQDTLLDNSLHSIPNNDSAGQSQTSTLYRNWQTKRQKRQGVFNPIHLHDR
jgi:cell division septation protein DedD